MNVVRRINSLCRQLCSRGYRVRINHTAVKHGFRRWQTSRSIVYTDDADMRVHGSTYVVEVVKRGDAGQGEIAATARELPKAPTTFNRPQRELDLCDHL